jgi:signal transduction histidine kinase/ligand-binding sensor domain-containing protein
MWFLSLLLVLFLANPAPVAQGASWKPVPDQRAALLRFEHITTDDGLSASGVTSIVQDERGFIWLATQNGLNRYDGYSFKVFHHEPQNPDSLSANNLRVLLVDGSRLWIGTWGGGLDELNLITGQFKRHQADPNKTSSRFINSIYKDPAGLLWLGTTGGLYHFNPTTSILEEYHPPGASQALKDVYQIVGDEQHRLWFNSDSSLFLLDQASGELTSRALPDNLRIQTLWLDPLRGEIWAGLNQGILRTQADLTAEIRHYNQEQGFNSNLVSSFHSPDNQTLLAGTEQGLIVLDLTLPVGEQAPVLAVHTHDPADPFSLADDFVIRVFTDRAGSLWVSHWTSGISVHHPSRAKFSTVYPIPLPLAFAPDGAGGLWAGTVEGLYHLDSSFQVADRLTHENSDLPHNMVFALLYDQQGQLWIGTFNGLARLDADDQTLTLFTVGADGPPGARVRSLFQDSLGRIWAGTNNGLGLFSPDGTWRSFSHQPDEPGTLSSSTVLSIFEDRQGDLWFGTPSGINRLVSEGEIAFTQPFAQPEASFQLGQVMVTVIQEDRQGALWLGTWGTGVVKITPDRQSVLGRRQIHGLADDVVLGIVEDPAGYLWISTSRGLSRYDPGQDTFRTYDRSDGLVDIDFAQGAYFVHPQGELLFGGESGITHFDPSTLSENPHIPTVVLTDFLLFSQTVLPGPDSLLELPIEATEKITLSHSQANLAFEFAALNFASPEKNLYAYKMEGVDPEWIYTSSQRRFAAYTNLDPGNYTFQVRASNNDGVWNNDGAALNLTILPPWWQTGWAYGLYLVGAAGSLSLFIHLRTRQQQEKLKIQQQLLKQERRLRDILEHIHKFQEEDRRRIAREMHDGLAQTLAAMRIRSQVWRKMLVTQPEQLESELENLEAILTQSIIDLRRSIYNLRPLVLDEHGLLPALQNLAAELGRQYALDVQVNMSCPAEVFYPSLEQQLYRMTQELLHNVGKHACASHAYLSLKCDAGCLWLEVRDDGQGMDPSPQILEDARQRLKKEGGLGLMQLGERVELLGGNLSIKSSPGQGTAVFIQLPLGYPQEAADTT